MTPTVRIPDSLSKYAFTMSATVAVAFVSGAFGLGWKLARLQEEAETVKARIATVEVTTANLAGKYSRIVEENVLPPGLETRLGSMEKRLGGMEDALIRIEARLYSQPRNFRIPESSSASTGHQP